MKTIKILGLAAGFMMITLALTAFINKDKSPVKKETIKAEEKGFAVLELFTSEGCSSCPPADEVLAKIQKEASGKPIYLLAYHVDYWDRQGWKDIFSSADYTKRQVQYGRWLNTTQIYTPQVVINGKSEFIGSEEAIIRAEISRQLATRTSATLSLQAHQDNNGLNVHYQATGAFKGSDLVVAVVQKSAHSNVERGENAGRSLSHVQIVRKLKIESLNADGNGNVVVALPKDFNPQNWEVLGLIQNKSRGTILAAAKGELTGTYAAK